MSALMDKLKSSGSIKMASVLSESMFFNKKDFIPTNLPILNVAFSGDLNGGLVPGLSIFAGQSKSYKTLLALFCMKAYLDKYPDAISIVYDSEFGITPEYLKQQGIDTSRVLHIPIEHVEQLKFDIVKRLDSIVRGDKVFVLVDSLGALASKKEVEDAIDEKSVGDMSRAKSIRSLLRIITPHLTMKDIPCIVINHTYQTMELYSKAVVGGGTAVMFSANQVFIITRSQEKEGTDVVGWNFCINIEKSRFVREKSKLSFLVTYDGGINKYSGVKDLALEYGSLVKTGNRYQVCDKTTGEIAEKKYWEKDISDEMFDTILKDPLFVEYVKQKYSLTTPGIANPTEGEDE